MKGTDLSEEQIESAREFLRKVSVSGLVAEVITLDVDDLARVVAWYGALCEARGGKHGSGKWESNKGKANV